MMQSVADNVDLKRWQRKKSLGFGNEYLGRVRHWGELGCERYLNSIIDVVSKRTGTNMPRQHNKPYIVRDSTTHALETTEYRFNEAWLRDFIFTHPQILPVDEIEPVFSSLIPVCTELPTRSGPVDNLFVNESGLLTLVECKLWKNPEARRTVIGQILDYAKDISQWTYEDLQNALRNKLGKSLFSLVSESGEDLDEDVFIDSVSRNLKRGRFLLLVVGEGIRESVELITDFLQRQAHLNFTFALVEISIFELPKEVGTGYLVHPRLVTRTIEIERAVIRLESAHLIAELPASLDGKESQTTRKRTTISEQVFYESLNPKTSKALQGFFDRATGLGIGLEKEPGQDSLMLKLLIGDKEYNLGAFKKNGTFRNYRIANYTQRFGYPEIGEEYLDRLASLFEGGYVDKPTNRFVWTVKKNKNQLITIDEILSVQDKWLELIRNTANKLLALQDA